MSTRLVTSTDGVSLAVTETGPAAAGAQAQTVVCVHGYPDDSSVWAGVVDALSGRYHVVTYDVRGAGDSDAPPRRDAYLLDQLVADLASVIDAVSPQRPVHLLGHDWGAMQCWHALDSERLAGRVASFTSVSGPSLAQSGRWLRSALRRGGLPRRQAAAQLWRSAYILVFSVPRLPELLWRSGVLDRGLDARSGQPRGSAARRPLADKINGLQLYRANMLRRRPAPRRTDVPVQVLAPERDRFVSPALQTHAPAPWTADLRTRVIPGGHWVIATDPAVVAYYTTDLIDRVSG